MHSDSDVITRLYTLLSTQTTKHVLALYFQILNITNVPVQSEWLSYCCFLCPDPAVFCGLWRWAGTMEEELCYSTVIFKPSDNEKPTGMFRFFLSFNHYVCTTFPLFAWNTLRVVFLFLDDQNINELINACLKYSRVRGDCIICRGGKKRINFTYNLWDFRLEITCIQNMCIYKIDMKYSSLYHSF